MQPKLAILAGGGELPRRLIGLCRSLGRDYFVIAFAGQADADTVTGSPHQWIKLGSVGELFEALHREAGATLVFVTHSIEIAARYATHVALAHEGAIVSGERRVVLQAPLLSRAFGDRGELVARALAAGREAETA